MLSSTMCGSTRISRKSGAGGEQDRRQQHIRGEHADRRQFDHGSAR